MAIVFRVKSFFDAIPPDTNRGKKVALVGVSSGRAGNLRGMEHLTGVLHYLSMQVMPNKLPISRLLASGAQGVTLDDKDLLQAMEKHVNELLAF